MNQPAARSRHLLACLGDPSRFRIVLALLEADRCVTELAGEVGLSQSCTTRHLQYLEREGIVRGGRQGKRVMFRLQSDRPRVRDLLAWVTASPAVMTGERGGASLHAERPGRGRRPAAGPGGDGVRPPRSGRKGMPLHLPATDLPGGSDLPEPIDARPAPRVESEARAPTGPGPYAPAEPGPQAPADPESRPQARPSEMEDWLL